MDRWTEVDQYLEALFVPSDAALEAANAADVPPHGVSPLQGKLLWMLARMQRAERVLEIGTLAGYSTIWLARALPPHGRLVTLEADPRHAAIARENIARAGLGDAVDVRIGPALETLSRLDGTFDLIFIDADKRSNPEYLSESIKLSHDGTVIVADNVVREGAVLDADSADPSVQGVRRFHAMIAADPRLTATALQTVGCKGWDGFTIVLVGSAARDQPGVA